MKKMSEGDRSFTPHGRSLETFEIFAEKHSRRMVCFLAPDSFWDAGIKTIKLSIY